MRYRFVVETPGMEAVPRALQSKISQSGKDVDTSCFGGSKVE